MMNWIQQYSSAINVLTTTVLVLITACYVYLTWLILKASEKQSRLSLAPVLGIKINEINISEVFGPNRRNMGVALELTNVGNAPAIEILVDSEIHLRYSDIKGEKSIPARFEPDMIPFMRPGETNNECHLGFGNTLITHFFDDVRESTRLNLHRIETNPGKESFKTSRIRVFTYYRNSIGQYFKSSYEIEIDLSDVNGSDPIPKDNKTAKVNMIYIPRPTFYAIPITSDIMEKGIEDRNRKRDLCGW